MKQRLNTDGRMGWAIMPLFVVLGGILGTVAVYSGLSGRFPPEVTRAMTMPLLGGENDLAARLRGLAVGCGVPLCAAVLFSSGDWGTVLLPVLMLWQGAQVAYTAAETLSGGLSAGWTECLVAEGGGVAVRLMLLLAVSSVGWERSRHLARLMRQEPRLFDGGTAGLVLTALGIAVLSEVLRYLWINPAVGG